MTEESEKCVRHLEMIQGVIERMARNSFLLKGWAVALVVASLWLTGRGEFHGAMAGGLVIVMVVAFGWLDHYYLQQERMFRELYNFVRKEEKTDFSMNAQHHMETVVKRRRCGKKLPNTLLWFYGPLLVVGGFLVWVS